MLKLVLFWTLQDKKEVAKFRKAIDLKNVGANNCLKEASVIWKITLRTRTWRMIYTFSWTYF